MLSRFLRRWFDSPRIRPLRVKHRRRLFMEPLEDRRLLATFLVTNTDDSGPGSLRQAILDAEFTPNVGGPDEIHFNIPGSGVHTINPISTFGFADGLPQIIDPVIIDGYTQSGASPNTLAVGDDAVLKIEINGSLLPGTNVFNFSGENSTVRGLAINQFPASAFVLGNFGSLVGAGNHNTFAGNFIGTDAAGLTVQVQGDSRAIEITAGSGNVFGGPAPADRNLITSPREMFGLQSGTGNVIQGNYLGVSKDGTAPLQPPSGTFGIVIRNDSGSNTIAGNVILGTNTGITLAEGTTGHNLVQGNFIGTNATGTAALGGFQGIDDQGTSDTIIGNVISGVSTGISINHQGPAGPGPTIQGNKIGTDITGTLAIPNSGHGIFVLSSPGGLTIGGTNPGDGNTIANNGGHGVFINVGTGCSILGNSIYANGNVGINLNGSSDGFTGPVTPNDPGDGDGDANGLQNYPELTGVVGGSTTTVTGTFNSTPNTTFRLEFFASDAADPTGFGEGQTFLGFTDVTTDGNGDVSYTATLPIGASLGQKISATATDPGGNTSEFSAVATVAVIGNDTPPVITSFYTVPASFEAGHGGNFLGTFSDPDSLDTWTGTINYGDGTGDHPLDLFGGQVFGIAKVYASPGIYTVTVAIADNHGGSDTSSLDVTVTGNTPPVITSFNTVPASFVTGHGGNFLGTFSDPDTLDTWTGTINYGDGTGDHPLDLFGGQVFGIAKVYASPGIYTVTVAIADNHGGSDTSSLDVSVNSPTNTSPHAVADAVSLTNGTSRTINVLANDSDPDGDPLTVTAVTQPASGHGVVTINANGTLTYTQTVYANGTETFTYTISDGHGGTAIATVTVTVRLPANIGINMLRSQVQHAGILRGLQISLDSTLRAAQQVLARGNSRAAANVLGAFANEVRALKRVRLLPASLADLWLLEDANILSEIRRR